MPQVNSFDLLLFGGTGDLAMRKLLPALYFRHRDGDLPPHGRILGLAREQLGRSDFIAKVRASFASFVPAADMDEATFATFTERLDYAKVEANTPEDFSALAEVMKASPAEVRVFFLSTAPDFFAPVFLKWAREPDYDAREVEGNQVRRLDLCFALASAPDQLRFFAPPSPSGVMIFPPGVYSLSVQVTADDVKPANAMFQVDFTSGWDRIGVSEARRGA